MLTFSPHQLWTVDPRDPSVCPTWVPTAGEATGLSNCHVRSHFQARGCRSSSGEGEGWGSEGGAWSLPTLLTEGWSRGLGCPESNPSTVLGSTARDLVLSGVVGGPAGMYALAPPPGTALRSESQPPRAQEGVQGPGPPSLSGRVLPPSLTFTRICASTRKQA